MSLILLNLESNQEIKLEKENPFIIGRKNVKGCFDQRVSRSHGKVTWTLDEKVHLVALHNNPCFFTRNGASQVFQLIKNEEEFLKEGDCVGLLPDSFWFQIKKISGEKNKSNIKEENNIEFELENKNIKEPHAVDVIESTSNNYSLKSNEVLEQNIGLNATNSKSDLSIQALRLTASDSNFEVKSELESDPNLSSSNWGFGNPEFEKTRKLPLWMYQVEKPIKNNPNIEVTFRNKPSKLEAAQPACKKIKLEQEIELTSTSTTVPSTSKVKDYPILESDFSLTSGQSGYTPNKVISVSEIKSPEENFKYDENEVENILAKSTSKRPFCVYDSSCYRKNPQHKSEFCHPGDEDYIPYENRPLCQYGESCYRQNKIHKVEFRHSKAMSKSRNSSPSLSRSPPRPAATQLPPKRKRKTINQTIAADIDDGDGYDLEDPFINDASSDEYVPSDVNEEEEEMEYAEDTD